MKKVFLGIFILAIALALFLAGCELTTPNVEAPRVKPAGNGLVLNELFTISPDKYYAYSWLELFNPTDKPVPWVDDVFPMNTFVLGGNGVLVHTEDLDEGFWKTEVTGNLNTYNSLDFYYPDTAFVCGNNGLLQKYYRDPSGSFSVQDLNAGTAANIGDVQFQYLNNVGYLVGDGGMIKRSLNRGLSWTVQTSGVTTNLRKLIFVDFGNPPRIWTVGDSGTVLRKAGGALWTKQVVPVDKQATNFYGMIMTTDTGFVVGDAGTILFTRNAGSNWSSKISGVSTTLRSAFMSEDQQFFKRGRAWVVGDNGVILRSDNYGDTWTPQQSGVTTKLNKVVFGDSLRGAVFGDAGTILHTSDGGYTWRAQTSPTAQNLIAASMLPLTIKVENYYVLEMVAKRKTFFLDFTTGQVNFDYFTKIDTGLVRYDPQFLVNFGAPRPKDFQPYAFLIINSDSSRFKDHIKLGPGQTQLLNLSIGLQPDTILHPILWDLLAAGEVRLVKYYVKRTVGGSGSVFLGFDRRVIDMIRYGGFNDATAAAYNINWQTYPVAIPWESYPQNIPLGFIPEGFSVARYANDGGGQPVEQQSTAHSFYFASDPIPGWFSQESRK